MHRCTIYGLSGPGSRLVIEVPKAEVAASIHAEIKKKERTTVKHRIHLRTEKEKTFVGTRLALR